MEYQYIDPKTGELKTRKVYFPIPKAKIPVIENTVPEADAPPEITFYQWGKRQGEDPEFEVPVTGWARLLSLKEGKWNRYQPRRVQIPAIGWMEKDADRQSHWFPIRQHQRILGVMIEQRGEKFVYIVTRPADGPFAAVHDRMPLLVTPAGIALPAG